MNVLRKTDYKSNSIIKNAFGLGVAKKKKEEINNNKRTKMNNFTLTLSVLPTDPVGNIKAQLMNKTKRMWNGKLTYWGKAPLQEKIAN